VLSGEHFQTFSHCSALSALRLFQRTANAADIVKELLLLRGVGPKGSFAVHSARLLIMLGTSRLPRAMVTISSGDVPLL
jgi:hypothetical protein